MLRSLAISVFSSASDILNCDFKNKSKVILLPKTYGVVDLRVRVRSARMIAVRTKGEKVIEPWKFGTVNRKLRIS